MEHELGQTPLIRSFATTALAQAARMGLVDLDHPRLPEPDNLTKEQRTAVGNIIYQVFAEPSITPAELVQILESLLAHPALSHGDVYEALETQQRLLMHRIAQRAYAAGLACIRQEPEPGAPPAESPNGPEGT